MTMFDSIIAETNERFNLDGKAETLLSALIALINDKTRGGLTGFLERFNQAGVNEATSSGVGSVINADTSSEQQLESVLGTETLNEIANQSGTDYKTTTAAIAFMLPRVVDRLTRDGIVPQVEKSVSGSVAATDINAETQLTAEDAFDRIGTAAITDTKPDKRNSENVNALNEGTSTVVDRVDANVDTVHSNLESVGGDEADDNSPLAWILPLLLLGLLLVLGYWFCSKSPGPGAIINTNLTVSFAAIQ